MPVAWRVRDSASPMLRVTVSQQRQQARPRPRRDGGFTMIELVMIIVLLGILAVVVVPSFNSRPFLARGFFDEVKTAARHAQKLAVASGCETRLAISASSYALQQRAGCLVGAWSAASHPARGGDYAGTAPDGTTIAGADIDFHPDGASGGGAVTVGGHSFTVAVTGHVSGD